MLFGQFVEYKGYIGSIEYSFEDDIYYGNLLNIRDLVTYEGSNIGGLYNSYHEAIDDYIEFIKEIISNMDQIVNKMCKSESDHEWECCGIGTDGSAFRYKKCGAYKKRPFEYQPLSEVTLK